MRLRFNMYLFALFFLCTSVFSTAQTKITTPESHFGFKPGADKKLIRWDRLVKYFYKLEHESDRLKVLNMGPSTMGNPFLVLLFSSSRNLNNLDRLQDVNHLLSNPGKLDTAALEKLVQEGKAVICQSYGLHSSEVGGVQSTPGLAYNLVSSNDKDIQRILDNVLFFMIPNFNPDGDIMINDWYRETVGTKYEGTGMPWLYHKYIGHDTNRDGDFLNMIESQYAAKIMYVDWPAQAYIDHHQMGSYGARFFVPPYCEPIRPYADPLIWREISWYGSHIAYKLEEKNIKGVLNSAMFPGWGHFGWHWVTPFHNIAGMLTESASAKLATPLYIHPEQLKGGSRQFPEYKAQSTFPSPWKGGWWRLADIVKQKQIASLALLDLAARNKETVLRNAYQKAKRQTARGRCGEINGVVIPAVQHDALTMKKMINTLLKSGIQIERADRAFNVDNRLYKDGSFFISLAQPKMGLIRNLLIETHYADNDWTHDKNGSILRPYDLSTHTMNEFMGVKVIPVKIEDRLVFKKINGPLVLKGRLESETGDYLLDGQLNDSFKAVNLLLNKGIKVKRITTSAAGFKCGDFIISGGQKKILSEIAVNSGVNFQSFSTGIKPGMRTVKRNRVGMYRRYWGGNMDEGWTRFLLEQFNFPYKTIRDDVFKKGNMNKSYDVIILPSDSPGMITGKISERLKKYMGKDIPKKYQSGIGEDGIRNLKKFVEQGGTLVTFGRSYKFAVEEFDLQIKNVTDKLSSDEFFCGGSTLKADFDTNNPLAWGMPAHGLVLFVSSPAFEVTPGRHNEDYKTIVRYKSENILKSGWLVGEKIIAAKSAMMQVNFGKGKIILIGFRTQHRAQTHGTFKFLFNTIIE